MAWLVYVLVSRRAERTYVGIAIDVARRLGQHNGVCPGGAKATRAFRPWKLGLVHGPFASRGEAQRVERRVKKLRGRRRLDTGMALEAHETLDRPVRSGST